MAMNDLYYGLTHKLSDYGAYYDGSKAFVKPQKDVEFVSVPGRNGDLAFSNNRYMNVEIHFNCFIKSDFIGKYADLINDFSEVDNYDILSCDSDPGVDRLAYFVAATEPQTGQFNDLAQFDLVFNCKPQKYIDHAFVERSLPSSTTTIDNPGKQVAYPLFYLTGGNGTLYWKDSSGTTITEVTVTGAPSNVFLDTEIQDAYYSSNNMNSYVTLSNGYPTISRNGNKVSWTGFSSVSITPRTWRL